MKESINIFKGSDHYSKLLDSFSVNEKLKADISSKEISIAIFYHLFKMKQASWRLKINFKRKKRHSLSDFFQDIIAFYLKVSLPDSFEIELESKRGKTQTDIAVKYKEKYIFIIEAKTTIGWDRQGPRETFSNRINQLSENFNIPKENVIYIFEDHANVNKEFSERYWNKKLNIPVEPPKEFPFSQIKPLFNGNDPYYWKHDRGFDKKLVCKDYSNDEILEFANKNIVTKFEEIIDQIMQAATKLNSIE